jgi:hypothetical protein
MSEGMTHAVLKDLLLTGGAMILPALLNVIYEAALTIYVCLVIKHPQKKE